MYYCDLWVKTKKVNLRRVYFQFLSRVMVKTKLSIYFYRGVLFSGSIKSV